MTTRRRLLTVSVAALVWLGPGGAEALAQFSDPCEVRCALVLGGSSAAFGTGVMIAVGRLNGGYSTTGEGITTWSIGFAAAAAAGMALAGDGERQRRAIHGSALGAVGGAVAALAVESLVGDGDSASRFAATLVGAALGVAAGGAVAAATHGGDGSAGAPTLTFVGPAFSLPFGP